MNNNVNGNIKWHNPTITSNQRCVQKQQTPVIFWFTGLSGSGKSTIANAVEQKLFALNKHSYLLDGDNIRHGLNSDLTFSEQDRIENIRRIGEVSKLFIDAGLIVLTAFISPFQRERDSIRHLVGAGQFIEIFVDTPIAICAQRDPKGLYKKAYAGEITAFTGIDSPYEAPKEPEIHIKTEQQSMDECAQIVVDYYVQMGC